MTNARTIRAALALLAAALLAGGGGCGKDSPATQNTDAGVEDTAADVTAPVDTGAPEAPPADVGVPNCTPVPAEDAVCSEDGWCWSNPLPTGEDLRALLVVDRCDVWVGGDSGTIIHSDGTRWTRAASHFPDSITGFWAAAPDDVWAVGGGGTLLHFDGTRWQDHTVTEAVVFFTAVWGSASDDVWAGGVNGELYWWNGSEWNPTLSTTQDYVHQFWGSRSDDVWATVGNGIILHYDGTGWRTVTSPVPDPIYSLSGLAADDIWAATSKKVIHFDGQSWSVQPTDFPTSISSFNSIWARGHDDVWMALSSSNATDPQLAHWDGQSWTAVSVGARGVTRVGGAGGEMWLVGIGGLLVHGDGTAFNVVSASAATTDLRTVAVAGASDVWAAGNSAQLRHATTGGWQTALIPGTTSPTVYLLWRAAPDDLWAVVSGTNPFGLARWNGTTWSTPEAITGLASPNAIWGTTGASDVFISGSTAVHRSGGGAWMNDGSRSTYAVWGSAANDVWEVGGYFYRWNGTTWTPTQGSDVLYGIWGTAQNDVTAVGDRGLIRHFDGQSWSTVNSGLTTRLNAVWGSRAGDAWIVGDAGVMLHLQNGAWSPAASGTERNLVAITGTAAGEAWVVGAGGAILHRRAR